MEQITERSFQFVLSCNDDKKFPASETKLLQDLMTLMNEVKSCSLHSDQVLQNIIEYLEGLPGFEFTAEDTAEGYVEFTADIVTTDGVKGVLDLQFSISNLSSELIVTFIFEKKPDEGFPLTLDGFFKMLEIVEK